MEKDLGKINKNETTDIVLRIDDFGGRMGLTIREFVTSERYTGFTKAGVRIPVSEFKKFKKMIDSVSEEDLEQSQEKSQKDQKTLDDSDEIETERPGEELPDY